jgi:peroxiredoxin
MKRSLIRSPYLWAIVFVLAVVAVAWVGRTGYKPVLAGVPAPNFVATDSAGHQVSLTDFKGKVVLINIWATWCPPCREEMPSLERLREKFKDNKNFRILAVSVDARPGQIDPTSGHAGGNAFVFADTMGLTFHILWDPSRKIEDLYQTTGVPESFLVGRDGVIYKKVAGGTKWDAPENVELVRRLLEG